jgi:hypothetical protein
MARAQRSRDDRRGASSIDDEILGGIAESGLGVAFQAA